MPHRGRMRRMNRNIIAGGSAGFSVGVAAAAAIFSITVQSEGTFLAAEPTAYLYAVLTLLALTFAGAAIGTAVGRRRK